MMSAHCDVEELEGWLDERLDGAVADRVAAHVAGCADCTGEVAWLRRERELLQARRLAEEPIPLSLWQGVERRLAAPRRSVLPRRARGRWLGVAAVAAAAAAVLVVPGALYLRHKNITRVVHEPHRPAVVPPVAEDDTSVVLDQAEAEYQEAIAVLESEYRARRPRLPARAARGYDETLAQARASLDGAREARGATVDDRIRLLDGYADYVHALQTIVDDDEVSR